MDIRITSGPSGGSLRAIPSKSAAHRIMIALALSGVMPDSRLDGLSEDITATKKCLEALMDGSHQGLPEEQPVQASAVGRIPQLPCGESGSTLRFLIPVAASLGIDADFHCEGRLPDRPMDAFLRVLAEHGSTVSGRTPKQLRGALTGGTFRLPGDISSQYVTGLLFALPLLAADSRIVVEGTLQSRPYIDLTLEVLAKAGIQVSEGTDTQTGEGGAAISCTTFDIKGGQKYQMPASEQDRIEGDWSNAAFWIVMDAMNRRLQSETEDRSIHVTGLDPDSRQGDREIVEVTERMEAADQLLQKTQTSDPRSREGAGAAGRLDISVPGRSGFLEIDVSNIPDLVPAISVLACGRPAGAVTHIANAGRLRFKESDRLRSVTEVLQSLGADITEEQEGLMICGTGTLKGGKVSSFGDHRIAMMAAAAGCIAKDDIVICGAEAVNKSYPRFFEDYQSLGGRLERL